MMWKSGAVVLLVLLLHQCTANSESHAGLSTTFGQTNKQPPQNNQNNNAPPRGKLCSVEANCSAFINTSCVRDPRDGKTRCLCGDRKPPNNGMCKNTHMGIGFKCMMDSDCIDNAECVDPNAMSSNMTLSTTTSPATVKTCQCRVGYEEDDNKLRCTNGAGTALLSLMLVLASVYVQLGKL